MANHVSILGSVCSFREKRGLKLADDPVTRQAIGVKVTMTTDKVLIFW